MKAWTDYPVEGSNNCIMREVVVARFDHNKYATMDDGESFKAGYLYRSRRKVPFKHETLCRRFPIGSNN